MSETTKQPEAGHEGTQGAPEAVTSGTDVDTSPKGTPSKPSTLRKRTAGSVRRSAAQVFTAERSVERMIAEGFPPGLIADKTGLSLRQVRRYAARVKTRWSAEDAGSFLRQAMARVVEDARSARGAGKLGVALQAERLLADLLGRRVDATVAKGGAAVTEPDLADEEIDQALADALLALAGRVERGEVEPTRVLREHAAELVRVLGPGEPVDVEGVLPGTTAPQASDLPAPVEVVTGSADYQVAAYVPPPPRRPRPAPRPLVMTEVVERRTRTVTMESGAVVEMKCHPDDE